MGQPGPPKTVFVAGARRGAGKTLVSAFLLRSLPGTGGVKLTCCRIRGGCPRSRPCGVCRALSSPFAVVTDHDVLAQPGKDTARLLEAAPGRVVWLQSRPEALADGLAAALATFRHAPAVVVEGNAGFQARRPDLGLLVIGAGPEPPKPSVNVALPFVDGVMLNGRPGHPPPAMVEGVRPNLPTFAFDAARPEGQPAAQELVEWVARELGLNSSRADSACGATARGARGRRRSPSL